MSRARLGTNKLPQSTWPFTICHVLNRRV